MVGEVGFEPTNDPGFKPGAFAFSPLARGRIRASPIGEPCQPVLRHAKTAPLYSLLVKNAAGPVRGWCVSHHLDGLALWVETDSQLAAGSCRNLPRLNQ